MADDVEIVFVEQWHWSAGARENTEAREVFLELINEYAIGPRMPSEEKIRFWEVNNILGGEGNLSFVNFTQNFIDVYDQIGSNGDGIVTLDELAKAKLVG